VINCRWCSMKQCSKAYTHNVIKLLLLLQLPDCRMT
jgi:hypothetical protein